MTCVADGVIWNRSDLTFITVWEISGQNRADPSLIKLVRNAAADVNMRPETGYFVEFGYSPTFTVTPQCVVVATTSHGGQSEVTSAPITLSSGCKGVFTGGISFNFFGGSTEVGTCGPNCVDYIK